MAKRDGYEVSRGRGIAWVCDIVGSSKLLNDNGTADATEQFLPRLYWFSRSIVNAAGGRFIKWTGDGFLAWFDTELDRDLESKAKIAAYAAWQLTVITNVTNLGVQSPERFKLSHGMCVERDALLLSIDDDRGNPTLDVLGRGVVLAFRLSGFPAAFPGLAVHRDIAEAIGDEINGLSFSFVESKINETDRLRYFKGEKWGTGTVFTSGARKRVRISLAQAQAASEEAIARSEGRKLPSITGAFNFAMNWTTEVEQGPKWAADVYHLYLEWLNELQGSTRSMAAAFRSIDRSEKKSPSQSEGQ